LASEKTKEKVWLTPLPDNGDTETAGVIVNGKNPEDVRLGLRMPTWATPEAVNRLAGIAA